METLRALSTLQLTFIITLSLLAYGFCLCFYRLFFHPLRKFPGPKLAALTLWYEFYYDIVLRGQFTFHIAQLHKQYGPIVRINPHELHIAAPDFYDSVYVGASVRRTQKYYWSARAFHTSGSMLATVSHELHRARRQPLAHFFSRASVDKLEPLIKANIEALCQRLERVRGANEPFRLDLAFTCLTTDIITEYCFGKSWDFLKREDFAPEWTKLNQDGPEQGLLDKQVPWIHPLMKAVPLWLVTILKPNIKQVVELQRDLIEQIRKVRADADADGGMEKTEGFAAGAATTSTIFHELIQSDLPASEKSLERLAHEAQILVGAGTLTTAHFLYATTFHLLANPSMLARLSKELEEAMPDPDDLPSTYELEKLPYLSAVVDEGLRVTFGVTSRLPRISPDVAIQYKEWTIPAGTPVSMTSYIQHTNSQVFPDPEVFDPERFLSGRAKQTVDPEKLEKYLVNFSRGTRACLGINLARAEMYLALAAVVRRFGDDLELFETDKSDVDIAHDFFVPVARLDSKGVRVVVKTSTKL